MSSILSCQMLNCSCDKALSKTWFGTEHLEELPSALCITGCDDGRVHVQESLRLKELVRSISEGVSDPRHRSNSVRTRPEVCFLPKIF